jgi:dienelactone hydrolase
MLLLLVIISLHVAAADTAVPWDMKALSSAPQTFPAPGFEAEGVKAIFYEGVAYQGKPARVFAWYGLPERKDGQKAPAMVLIHGGGGTAFAEWVRLWVKRGYAAIAMDTCGCVPKGEYGKWERSESGGPAGWGGFDNIDDATADQWTYHAVAAAILGHSLIRSMPEVDADRTGVTGISWGGYLTCIVAGVDARFKCAVPVYGCGFLGRNSAWVDKFNTMGPEKSGKWLAIWDPSVYLPRAAMPVLWVTGTNDFAYPMDSLQSSYGLPAGPSTLCLRIRMPHGHGGAGENPEEIHAFADSFFTGGAPLAKITGHGRDGQKAWATFASKTPIKEAALCFTKDTGKWQERKWDTIPAQIDNGKATATLPEGTTVYYLNLTDDRQLIVSSPHETM